MDEFTGYIGCLDGPERLARYRILETGKIEVNSVKTSK